jgi:hypothetical protein
MAKSKEGIYDSQTDSQKAKQTSGQESRSNMLILMLIPISVLEDRPSICLLACSLSRSLAYFPTTYNLVLGSDVSLALQTFRLERQGRWQQWQGVLRKSNQNQNPNLNLD